MQRSSSRQDVSVILALLAVAAGASGARSGPVISVDAGMAHDAAARVDDDIYWEQLPTAGALTSQDVFNDPATTETTDDFVGNGAIVYSVSWWGLFFQGSPIPPEAFTLRVYADDGRQPGAIVEDETITNYHEFAEGSFWSYCTDELSFNAQDGVTYHLSIQAVLCFPPQWGRAGGDGNGVHGWFRSAFFGYPDWTDAILVDGESEFAFVVGNYTCTGATPVASRSWSAIKGLYGHP